MISHFYNFERITTFTYYDVSQLKNLSINEKTNDERFNYDKLNIEWWINKIRKNVAQSYETFNFDNTKEFNYIYKNYYKSLQIDSYKKRFKTLIRKLLEKTNLKNLL